MERLFVMYKHQFINDKTRESGIIISCLFIAEKKCHVMTNTIVDEKVDMKIIN